LRLLHCASLVPRKAEKKRLFGETIDQSAD